VIEVIATTVEDAIEIEAGGANRIELISMFSEGGLTPSYKMMSDVIKAVKIPVNIMIRPHSHSFVYTDTEINLMKKDIETARMLGANGIVFGVLTEDNIVDTNKLENLLSVCSNLEVTFHRAIDETNVLSSVKKLAVYKEITNILTSGGLKAPLHENTNIISNMMTSASQINILVGGGLTMDNIIAVATKTKAANFHFGSTVQTNGNVVREKVELLMRKMKDLG